MSKLLLYGLILFISSFLSLCEGKADNPMANGDSEDHREDYLPEPDEFVPLEVVPEMLGCDSLVYPERLEYVKLPATVWVKVLVAKSGDVLGALVGKSSGSHILDHAALENAVTCDFRPGIQNGRPVAVWVTFAITFKPPSWGKEICPSNSGVYRSIDRAFSHGRLQYQWLATSSTK